MTIKIDATTWRRITKVLSYATRVINCTPRELLKYRGCMLSQMARSFTTHLQFVPTCEQTFGGILSWTQTLIRSFAERQLSHKVHAYLIHN